MADIKQTQVKDFVGTLREKVFLDRYALKGKDGELLEHTPEETWQRVARGIAQNEKVKDRKKWEKQFYDVMSDFKFVPGGRILSGAGTNYQVTYFNCFVIPSPKDSRDGILESLKQLVEIQSRSGGVGLNLSSLRPRGARVHKVNGTSSGPVTWAGLFSYATHDVVQQGGCFSEDAKIMTHKGLVSIKEIVESQSTYFAATHNGYQKVTAKFNNGVKKLYTIKTKAGYSVKTTAEHKFVTVDSQGHFYLKQLADFNVGDTLVMHLGEWLEEMPLVVLNTDIPAPSKFSYGRIKRNLPKVLDEKLAFILGVYDADGSKIRDEFSPNGKGLRIAIAQDRPQDLEKLTQTLQEVFGTSPKVAKGDGAVWNVAIYSREVNEFLQLNGLLKKSSVTVQVPELLYSSPRKVVEAYIAGVFFGDGSNRGGKGSLRITTVSKEYASQIQLLLLNLGIASKIKIDFRSRIPSQKNWLDIYTITVNGNRFMTKFAQILAPYNQKVGDHPVSLRDATFNWPFNLTEKFLYLSGFQRTIARTNVHTSHKAVAFLEQHVSDINEKDREDVGILATSVPDEIAAIEQLGEETVYDLEVDNVHLLSGNGFYTSNSRRGATMLMLWDWHPDIEEFITVKQDLSKINGANLSVCISDAFMEAVKQDKDWDLVYPDIEDPEYDEKWDGEIDTWKKLGKKVKVYKTVKAKYLWDLICTAAWQSAEPGLHFMERSNKRSNTFSFERLVATNPCGEQPLGPWAVCNLGAMNLSAYVRDADLAQDKSGWFDFDQFGQDVKIAMRMLDNVIDQTYYFFKENEKCAKDIRRTGLGIMGLGDALIKMHLPYGSEESLPVISKIFQTLRDNAYEASSDIAKEKGSFPKFVKAQYMKGYHIQNLPKDLQKKIAKQGIRNAVLLTIAPTGTTSLVSGVSSGVEPVYEFSFLRRWRGGEDMVYHPLFEIWKNTHEGVVRPAYFVGANDLTPLEHVKVQAVAQEYIDSSISKTVNAPNSHTVEDVKSLYMAAYDYGLKGVTYMRDGSRQGVFERVDEKKDKKEVQEPAPVQPTLPIMPMVARPQRIDGTTYQTETPMGDTFITINHTEDGQPFEVFITIGKSGSDVSAMAEALARMISINLRVNSMLAPREKVRQIVAQLTGIGGARSIGFGPNRVRSLPDAVAKILAQHYQFAVNGKVEDRKVIEEVLTKGESPDAPITHVMHEEIENPITVQASGQLSLGVSETHTDTNTSLYDICPECGVSAFAYEDGCKKCYNCGHSEC